MGDALVDANLLRINIFKMVAFYFRSYPAHLFMKRLLHFSVLTAVLSIPLSVSANSIGPTSPDQPNGLCYPELTLCFTLTEFNLSIIPISDPGNPTITGFADATAIGDWSYWDDNWNETVLYWDIEFSDGSELSLRLNGSGIIDPLGGGQEHVNYTTIDPLVRNISPDVFIDPWIATLSGMRTYDPSYQFEGIPIYECGSGVTGEGLSPVSGDCDTLPAVPVPATVWLFGTALVGLVGFSKRRKAA